MSRERELLNRIHEQADKIKELEADWLDEYTKCQLIGKKLTALEKDHNELTGKLKTLQNIQNYLEYRLKDNEKFQQVIKDLQGGVE